MPFRPGSKEAPYVVNVKPTPENGLDRERFIDVGQIRSVDHRHILGKVGELEEEYSLSFSESMGAPDQRLRTALGALIIKEKLGISDRETVEQIKENPYLQYFIGMSSYSQDTPFDASMLVHFRQRIGVELVNRFNQTMVKNMLDDSSAPKKKKN